MRGKMHIASGVLMTFLVSVAFAACGGDWPEYEPNAASLPDDKTSSLTYPTGTTGTKAGELVMNHQFAKALFDPEFMCKGVKDMKLANTEGAAPLSMEDLYRGDLWCGSKKQFLWIVVTAGW